ncbi:M20/M25/M40 family metallo-hydrolase [Brevibacillus ruminantium]|uniref:M20/M25/M40 family metallo-hydrolase n=1 Tax=Brevibacillus ruminantium TaxID=2950604 RepID=UPI002AC84684|nr:M20/M25/M40 family metallo-hydrolase [Brevibacillus ruminantium]
MATEETEVNSIAAFTISDDVKARFKTLMANTNVKSALEFIKSDNERTLGDQIEITEIPAPPFKEEVRANYYKKRLKELKLADVMMDSEGSVFGVRRGTGNGPTLFISAHLDTVFPEGTDTKVRKEDGKYIGPGIADDGRGLAALLSLVRTFEIVGLQTRGNIIFGAVVGEEGLGDLRGVKAMFRNHQNIDGYISIEPGRPTRTIYLATGSLRYNAVYKGPGGHSYGAFGHPSHG